MMDAIKFQSTLPVWGATSAQVVAAPPALISIHAPRVGSDVGARPHASFKSYFNPRSPCGERLIAIPLSFVSFQFQSTLPVWGATENSLFLLSQLRNFNPRSPCGERRGDGGAEIGGAAYFNPRSPCGERRSGVPNLSPYCIFQSTLPVWGATPFFLHWLPLKIFQSTLPVWGATLILVVPPVMLDISIHAPRVGSDMMRLSSLH